jgi:hypothetical protein
MSGVLNSKQRIIDTFLTVNGRKNIASKGGLDITYVTFSDSGTYYTPDIASGSSDATLRLYPEACNLPQDTITFPSSALSDGTIDSFQSVSDCFLLNGRLHTYVTGSSLAISVSDSQFNSLSDSVIKSSYDSLSRLNIIKTTDAIFEEQDFAVAPSSIEFVINDSTRMTSTIDSDSLEELFCDPRFSTKQNFQYLPPLDGSVEKKPLGNYKSWGGISPVSYENVKNELTAFSATTRRVTFDPTSINNKCVCQIFEIDNGTIRKLDVVDYGIFNSENGIVRVFFAGRRLLNDFGNECFVHIFTILVGDS